MCQKLIYISRYRAVFPFLLVTSKSANVHFYSPRAIRRISSVQQLLNTACRRKLGNVAKTELENETPPSVTAVVAAFRSTLTRTPGTRSRNASRSRMRGCIFEYCQKTNVTQCRPVTWQTPLFCIWFALNNL